MTDATEKVTTIVDDGAKKELEELKKKYSDLESQNKELSEFYKTAAPVVQLVYTDEELRTNFNDKWSKATGQKKEEPKKDKDKEIDKEKGFGEYDEKIKGLESKVTGIEDSTRADIIRSFEAKYGINRLSSEEASKKRKSIVEYASMWGNDLKSVPVDRLAFVLENSIKNTDPEIAKKAEDAGYTRGYVNGIASMPTMQSGSVQEPEGNALDEKQKKWATKLGVDLKRAEEIMKNRENEKVTPSKAEKPEK